MLLTSEPSFQTLLDVLIIIGDGFRYGSLHLFVMSFNRIHPSLLSLVLLMPLFNFCCSDEIPFLEKKELTSAHSSRIQSVIAGKSHSGQVVDILMAGQLGSPKTNELRATCDHSPLEPKCVPGPGFFQM